MATTRNVLSARAAGMLVAFAMLALHMAAPAAAGDATKPGIDVDESLCSTKDASVGAVIRCTNAVRLNPEIMKNAYCYDKVKDEVTTPKRRALFINADLTEAAIKHNGRMIATGDLSHRLAGESTFGARVRADSDWDGVSISEIIAADYSSAYTVVEAWFCSDPHRESMFSCDYDQFGSAASQKYYTQILGCDGFGCNSCGSGTASAVTKSASSGKQWWNTGVKGRRLLRGV